MYTRVASDPETTDTYYVYQHQKRKRLAQLCMCITMLANLLLSVGIPLLLAYAVHRRNSIAVGILIVIWLCLFVGLVVVFNVVLDLPAKGTIGFHVLNGLFMLVGVFCFVLGVLPPHPMWVDILVLSLFAITTQVVTVFSMKQLYATYANAAKSIRSP